VILKSIKMQNFRKFKSVEIDFPDGVVGIFGLNGVGKSTIFEAFAWALYGHTAARTSSDKIKRDKALPTDRCRVEVEFVFNQNNIRVIREMIGKNLSPSAMAFVNNRLVANGAEATTRFVQNLFGMDAKTFFTSIFAKQKELNALSAMNASERKQLIMRMLGIDALDKAIRNIRSDIRKSQEIIQHYQISLKDEKTGRDKEEIFKEEIERDKEKLNSVEKRIDEKKKLLDALSIDLKNLEEEKNRIQNVYEDIQRRLEEERKKKELFDKKRRLEDEIEKLRKSVEERKKSLEEKERELRELQRVKEDYDDVEKKLEEAKNSISSIVGEIEREKAKIDGFEREKRKAENKKSRIESLGPSALCPTCERPLGEQYVKLIEKFNSEIRESEEEIRKIKENIKVLEEKLEKSRNLEEALIKKRKYLLDAKMKWERISTFIQSVNREIDREEKDIETRKREISLIGEVKFDEGLFKSLEERARQEYERYKESMERLRKKQIELDRVREEIKEIEGEANLLRQHIQELNQRIEDLKEMRKRMLEEQDKLSKLNVLEKIMGDFRIDLISRIRPTLSAYASSLLEILTDGKYSEMELNENYDIMIYDGGTPYEIGRFSGGEEDIANLCIRLSISQMLADRAGGEFNMIILDEIFGSQDVNRRRNILNALNSLSNRFRQIFVITHIEEVKQMVNNAIMVYEAEDGASKVRIE